MSYYRKYYGFFHSKKEQYIYRVELLQENGSGAEIELLLATSDPFVYRNISLGRSARPIVFGSECRLLFYIKKAQVANYDPLFQSEYKEWLVRLYRMEASVGDPTTGGALRWIGYAQPENLYRAMTRDNIEISLSATDALRDLGDIEFKGTTGVPYSGKQTIMEVIKNALSPIAIPLTFGIKLNTYETRDSSTLLTFLSKSVHMMRFYRERSGKTRFDSCIEVLEKLLGPFNCVLRQVNGTYRIENRAEKNSYIYFVEWSDFEVNRADLTDEVKDLSAWDLFPEPSVSMVPSLKRLDIIHRNRHLGGSLIAGDLSQWYTLWHISNGTGITFSESGGILQQSFNQNFTGFLNTGDPGKPIELKNTFSAVAQSANDYIKIHLTQKFENLVGIDSNADLTDYYYIKVHVKKPDDQWYTFEWHGGAQVEAWEPRTTPNVSVLRVTEDGEYLIKLEVVFLQKPTSQATWSFDLLWRDFDVTKVVTVAEGEVASDVTFDSFRRFESLGKTKVMEEEEHVFGDSGEYGDIGSFYTNNETENTKFWNRFGKTDTKPILEILGQQIMNSRARYKDYVQQFDIYDPDDEIQSNSIIQLTRDGQDKFYLFQSFEKSFSRGIIKARMVEVLYDDVNYEGGWAAPLTSVDGQETSSPQPTATTGQVSSDERFRWNSAYQWGNHASAGYATEVWVGQQGFATEAWVALQGFATEDWVETAATAYNSLRLGGVLAASYATQAWVENTAVAYDSARLGGYLASLYPRKAENASITGAWTMGTVNITTLNVSGVSTLTGLVKTGGSLAVGRETADERLHVAGNGLFEGNNTLERGRLRIRHGLSNNVMATLARAHDNGNEGSAPHYATLLIHGGDKTSDNQPWNQVNIGNQYIGAAALAIKNTGNYVQTLHFLTSIGITTSGEHSLTSVMSISAGGSMSLSGNISVAGTSTLTGAVTAGGNVGTSNFVAQTTGWRVTAAGVADFRATYLDSVTVGGVATFGNDLKSVGTFIGGFTGTEWMLNKLAGSPSRYHLTVDHLTVRGAMKVYELQVNRLRGTNGALIVTDTAVVEEAYVLTAPEWEIYIDTKDNTELIPFTEGDELRCQMWTGSGIKYYEVEVTGINQAAGYMIVNIIDGLDLPAAGDHIARVDGGIGRDSYIYITSSDDNAPYIDFVKSRNIYLSVGNLDKLPGQTGMGIWGSTDGANTAFVLSSDGYAKISTFKFDKDGLFSGTGTGISTNFQGVRLRGTTEGGDISVGLNATNEILMFRTALNWGIKGILDSQTIFSLGDTNKIANFTFENNYLFTGSWAHGTPSSGAGTGIVLDSLNNSVYVQRSTNENKIQLYNTDADNWGIKGAVGNNTIFQLGSTNQIANFEFGNGAIGHKDSVENRYVVMSNREDVSATISGTNSYLRRGFGYFAYDVTLGTDGTKAIRVGLLSNDAGASFTNNKYGFQIIQRIGSANKEIFRVDDDGAKIANIRFNDSDMWGVYPFLENTVENSPARLRLSSTDSAETEQPYLEMGFKQYDAGDTILNQTHTRIEKSGLKINRGTGQWYHHNLINIGEAHIRANYYSLTTDQTPTSYFDMKGEEFRFHASAGDRFKINWTGGSGGTYLLVQMNNLPTSGAGLPTGAIWRDGTTLKIVVYSI